MSVPPKLGVGVVGVSKLGVGAFRFGTGLLILMIAVSGLGVSSEPVLEAPALVAGLDDVAVMGQLVEGFKVIHGHVATE
jgi:hypothetical protein